MTYVQKLGETFAEEHDMYHISYFFLFYISNYPDRLLKDLEQFCKKSTDILYTMVSILQTSFFEQNNIVSTGMKTALQIGGCCL